MSFSRSFDGNAPRDATIPRFHIESVEDPVATARSGHPVFFDEERVQYIQPGNPHSPVERVTDVHRQRWPKEYKAFLDGQEMATDGVPIEHWAYLKRAHVLNLKAMGIFSVEQCAGLSDLACQQIGMGGRAIRDSARAYLDEAAAQAIVTANIAAREIAEAQVADLQRQLKELTDIVSEMHRQQMTQRDAPSPIIASLPDDPIATALQARQTPEARDAFGDMPTIARRRGRPPKQPEMPTHGV